MPGCANQAGTASGNVTRISGLLARLQVQVVGFTVNRHCESGMAAISVAARGIMSGENGLALPGGVEDVAQAPLLIPAD